MKDLNAQNIDTCMATWENYLNETLKIPFITGLSARAAKNLNGEI